MLAYSKTYIPSQQTITRYLCLLGILAACSLVLAALYIVVWLVQEVALSIIELVHIVSTCNPLIITACMVVIAVWLLGKVKTGKGHEKHAA